MSLTPNSFDHFKQSESFPFSGATLPTSEARTDWKETPEAHELMINLPGLKIEDVKVEIDGRILQISGESSTAREVSSHNSHSVRRSSTKFNRQFTLPENAETNQITYGMENGVLTVTAPKKNQIYY